MDKLVIKKDNVSPLFESRYIKVYDLEYKEGKHYYDATRRNMDDIVAIKSDEEFKQMIPDAVTCVVVIREKGKEAKLLLSREYRYPAGQFLLSPPAGLIDPSDKDKIDPIIETAKREIAEETGLIVKETDRVETINPLLFSSPGMTDESNALALAVIDVEDLSALDQSGAEGTELFDGFVLVDKEEASNLLKAGRDLDGIFYSVYTWAVLMYFVSTSF